MTMPGSLPRINFVVLTLALTAGTALPPPARGQDPEPVQPPTIYWPAGVAANPDIPSPAEYFGFEIGHRHLRHDQVTGYLRAVASVSERIAIQQYGQTHGGRPLLLLTITSPKNHSRLDEIRDQRRRLTGATRDTDLSKNPKTPGSDMPVVINMGYGVHGDEPSATNTAPLVAHYLAAAEGPGIDAILENCVILLDPALNPDGFDRFARWANTFRGTVPNPDPAHVEHRQGWPPGRVNYYWFDLNRDWLPLVHPESQARMKWYHQWKPNVVLDFHEMGTNATYFFQPGIPARTNPLTPAKNIELTRAMAGYHARDLDQLGSLYFTQEVFDDFYMGKGSTYPDLHGAVGILFEQASSRGHVQESDNGILQFSDTIRNQFTASLTSLRGATGLRQQLVEYQIDFYRKSVEQARQSPVRAWAFQIPANRSRLQRFAKLLVRHDIRCYLLNTSTTLENGRVLPAGSLIVPAAQPEYRFLRSLLERRKSFRENVFYDVSAWTIPLAFNLKQSAIRTDIDPQLLDSLVLDEITSSWQTLPHDNQGTGELENPDARPTVAWLMDWRDDESVAALQKLLAADLHVRVALKPFRAQLDRGPHSFEPGTIAIPIRLPHNQDRAAEIKSVLESAGNIRFHALKSGLADGGIDLGSSNFPRLQPRNVALLVGPGVSAYQAGEVWHQLDARAGMPVSLIRADAVAETDWSRYSTLVMVSGSYMLDEADLNELKRFVGRGGTLIAIGSATRIARHDVLGLVPPESETEDTETLTDENPEAQNPRFGDARQAAALELVSGAIFNTAVDRTHPLLFGVHGNRLPTFRTATDVLPAASNGVSNPIRYTDEPLLAGYASGKNLQQLASTSAVTVHAEGRGQVILLIDNPNFRGFWAGTSRVFMNAVYFGPYCRAPGD